MNIEEREQFAKFLVHRFNSRHALGSKVLVATPDQTSGIGYIASKAEVIDGVAKVALDDSSNYVELSQISPLQQ